MNADNSPCAWDMGLDAAAYFTGVILTCTSVKPYF